MPGLNYKTDDGRERSAAAIPNSCYIGPADLSASQLDQSMQARMEAHFPGTGGLTKGSGRALTLPDDVRSSIESHFGYSIGNLNFRESSDVDTIGAKAYARGDEIHFAPGQFRPDTALGRKMIGHEVAHVLQQSKGGMGGGVCLDGDMERQADLQGEAISSSTYGAGSGEALAPMPTASFSAAPAQGWGISFLHRKGKGEHERLTEAARAKASAKLKASVNPAANYLGDPDELESRKAAKSLDYGSRFNDVGTHTVLGMVGQMLIRKKDAFINQTHHGDMQFLHAMDTSGGDTEANVKKIQRYAQFASEVYQNRRDITTTKGELFQDQNMLDYVLSQNEEGDPFQEMMLSTMLSPKALKKIDKQLKKDKKSGTVTDADFKEQRIARMRAAVEFSEDDERQVRAAAKREYKEMSKKKKRRAGSQDDYVQKKVEEERNKRIKNRSRYARGTVGEFFTGGREDLDAGLVALGSASHMLEDSFAGSHAIRSDNLYLGGESDTELTDDGMDLANKATPIISNADYNQQSSNLLWGRHPKGDKFVNNDISGTQGGSLARDTAAQFIYMNLRMRHDVYRPIGQRRYQGSDLDKFVQRVTRADENIQSIGRGTSTGRGYDREFGGQEMASLEARGAEREYRSMTRRDVAGNRKTTPAERATQMEGQIMQLGRILNSTNSMDEKIKAKYVPHAREMLINIYSMLKQMEEQMEEDPEKVDRAAYEKLTEHKTVLEQMLRR